jgi:hypothetical protein
MDITHAPQNPTLDPDIQQAIDGYRPKLLNATQAAQALPRMRHHVSQSAPPTPHEARNRLISLSRLLADVAPPDSCDVDALLTEHSVSVWSHRQAATGGAPNTLKNHLARLNHLLRAKAGARPALPREPRPSPHRDIYDPDAVLALGWELILSDPPAAASVLAGGGAGIVVPDVLGSHIGAVDRSLVLQTLDGSTGIAPAWIDLAHRLIGVSINQAAWNRARRHATAGPLGELSHHKLRLTWAVALIESAPNAATALRRRGLGDRAIDAAVPHLDTPSPSKRDQLLRG